MVMRFARGASLLVIAVMTFCVPTLGYRDLSTAIAPQFDAPIRIVSCLARLGDVDYSGAFGRSSELGDYLVREQVSFVDVSPKEANAVTFAFDLSDIFSNDAGAVSGTIAGRYSHGALIRLNPWALQEFSDHGPALQKVLCSVDRVNFADGSTWQR